MPARIDESGGLRKCAVHARNSGNGKRKANDTQYKRPREEDEC
jgi:hypothetical protein